MSNRPPIDALRDSPFFYLVHPDQLVTLDDWAEYLDCLLHGNCRIEERNGSLHLTEERQLVAVVRGLRVEIYGNEHPPPHFHVRSAETEASFAIEDCRLLSGKVGGRELRAVRYWFDRAKPLLVETWNAMRPGDCPVGEFRDRQDVRR